jgi:2-keto-3-deoxy-galactonokinase
VLAEESNIVILDWGSSQFRKNLLLLNIEQGHGRSRGEDKGSSSTVKDIVGLNRTFNSLDDIVG